MNYLVGVMSILSRTVPIVYLLLLGGCLIPIRYDVSVPGEMPPGYPAEISDQTIALALPELTVSAQIQAYDWDGQYLLRPLGVWIEVDAADQWFTLDPRRVMLKSDEGDYLEPVSYLGPALSWHSPRALAAGCGPRSYHSGIAITNIALSRAWVMQANNAAGIYRPSRGPVTSEGRKCFMFWFDTDTMPVHHFLLAIDGISVDGKPVPVPKIPFQPGSLTTVRGIP